jgi:hypothetical protein
MKDRKLKELITEAVLSVMNEVTWPEIETQITKWFKLSPGLTGNIKSIDLQPVGHGLTKKIVLHDKRGNNVVLVADANPVFADKYLPVLSNLLSTLSGQIVGKSTKTSIIFK